MSRIGKNPVSISQGVDVNIKDNVLTVKGKLGELTQTISEGITVKTLSFMFTSTPCEMLTGFFPILLIS